MTTTDATVQELAAAAQHRGGLAAQRADGAFFTDADVASWLARRTIGARLLDQSARAADVDGLLADGADLVGVVVEACTSDASTRERVVDLLGSIRVLDPTCGAGSFLVTAWHVLRELEDRLGVDVVHGDQLLGVDCSRDAVDACRATLAIVVDKVGPRPRIDVGDAELGGVLPSSDVVLGNPPFVRATACERHADLATRRVPNRSAWIVERALDRAAAGARVSFVLPISTTCCDAFAPARACWAAACSSIHASHFDTIPSSLFRGVVQRLSIFEGRRRSTRDVEQSRWFTTGYHRWTRDERDGLLDGVRHVGLAEPTIAHSLPKVGTAIELGLLEQLAVHPPAGRWFVADPSSTNVVRYKRRWSYFLLFCDFVPALWDADGTPREPSELKSIAIDERIDALAFVATYSSTLFWWYFSVFTDNRNVNRRDLAAFPFPDADDATLARLAALGRELMVELHACAEVRSCTYRSIGTIRNTYFRQAATRPVLDRIDCELAAAYGLCDEQLEFVLGFERRFRS